MGKGGGSGGGKPDKSTVSHGNEASGAQTIHASERRWTALSCLTGCDRFLFLFGLLISYPSVIVQGYSPKHPKIKGGWVTCRDSQGKATAIIPDNAARGSLLTWTAVEIYSPAGA